MQILSRSFAFAVLLTIGFAPTNAFADRAAEQFVGALMQQASMVLRDSSGGEMARCDRLHRLVTQTLDARKTALFALGPYQRELDPGVAEEYVFVIAA